MTIKVTGIRITTGVREELNEFAAQAWRDGTTSEAFTDIREEPAATKHPDADCPDPCPYCAAWRAKRDAAPADASLEARAKMVKEALRAAGVGLLVTHPADGPRSLQAVVRAVDASRPGLTGDAWTALARVIATLAENDSLVDDAITAAERAGCPDATVLHLHEINDAMYRRRLRGSGLTEEQALEAAERALLLSRGWREAERVGHWLDPSGATWPTASAVDLARRASRGETSPAPADPPNPDRPAGLTRAMHDAAQRPSVPPRIEYEHGPDGETYRVEDDWQPCACGAAVSRGEAHPTGPGHDVDWSAVDRQRATPHAGAPASLADVVAASAREPHADVVLHALHVSGGAAAVDAMKLRHDPGLRCARCDKPVGATGVRDGEDVLCLPCSIDDLDGRDLDREP